MSGIQSFVRQGLQVATAIAPLRVALRGLARAGVLPESVWIRLPVHTTFAVKLPDGTALQYRSIAGDRLGRLLYWGSLASWDLGTTRTFWELAKQSRTVLDLGANTGIFTLMACAANPAVRVIAFEPVPNIYKLMIENIRANGWESRCDARMVAASDFDGMADFHIPDTELPTSASLNVEGFRGHAGKLVRVPVTTVNQALPADLKIDLAKIDVEGFEPQALRGMHRVLSESQPKLIIECLPDGPCAEIERILREYGYHFWHLRDEGPLPMDRIVPDPQDHDRNYLCSVDRDWRSTPSPRQ